MLFYADEFTGWWSAAALQRIARIKAQPRALTGSPGIAGNQVGGGGSTNVAIGAVLGGVLGGVAGNQVDERKAKLEAEEAQRQREYQAAGGAENGSLH